MCTWVVNTIIGVQGKILQQLLGGKYKLCRVKVRKPSEKFVVSSFPIIIEKLIKSIAEIF